MGFDPLAVWINEAHKRNIKVHTWFETFYIGNDNPTNNPTSILAVYPEWGNKTKKDINIEGPSKSTSEHNGYFLDPANPEVQEFLAKLIEEKVPVEEISQQTGCPISAIKDWIKHNTNTTLYKIQQASERERLMPVIEQALKEGKSFKQIERITGKTRQWIKKALKELGFDKMPVCMAKTQYSLSDNPALLGAPSGFTVNVKNAKISAGAGFIVIYTGDIMTMPGLPKKPAAESIDVTDEGKISGLF